MIVDAPAISDNRFLIEHKHFRRPFRLEAIGDLAAQLLHRVERGHERVRCYPWSATADGLAELYHRAAA